MTVTNQIKILNGKIKQNEAQYDLERKTAKTSALSSNNLDQYEYLTGEDLGLKPSTVEQAKFEHSPLSKTFNKGLKEEDKKEGLFKRLENNEDKNEELIKTFSKAPKNKVTNKDKQNKNLLYNSQHSFAKFKDNGEIKDLSLDSMHKRLKKFHEEFTSLKNVTPRIKANKNLKEKVLDNAGNLFNDRYYIYKNKYNEKINSLDTENKKKFCYKKLRLTDDYLYSSEEEQQQTSKKESFKKSTKTDLEELNEQIINEEKELNEELFKNYFNFQKPTKMLKNLSNLNEKIKNEQLVYVIKSELIDLKNEIKKMSEDDIKTEKLYKIVDSVEKILEFNKRNQQGKGLNILTPNQMLSRLPITLAQLSTGNNSEKLKNEIRQLLYSLYRSKKLTKQIYKSLIDII